MAAETVGSVSIVGVLFRTWLSSEVQYLVPASSNGTMVATTRLHSPVVAKVSSLSMVVEDTGAVASLAVCQTASTVMSLKECFEVLLSVPILKLFFIIC